MMLITKLLGGVSGAGLLLGFALAASQEGTARAQLGCAPGDPDADGDGICDAIDPCFGADNGNDSDGDRICDDADPCFGADNGNDSDGDRICDDADPCFGADNGNDSDGDRICDDEDVCPLDGANDQDDDGICDGDDECLGTPSGEPTLDDGCSIAQECSCNAPWRNHGAYVSCVAHAANDLVALGLITPAQKGAIVSAAGSSNCGKKK